MKIRLIIIYAFSLFALGNLLKAQLEMPLTWDEGLAYTFVDFGPDVENDGRPIEKATSIVADPDDAENMVAATIKPAGAEVWSGVTFWGVGEEAGLPSSPVKVPLSEEETKISIRVRSPKASIPILMKIENSLNATHFVETTATTTKVDEWETLTWDFSTPTGGTLDFNELLPVYNRITLFFDFGTGGGASDTTYYFENVSLGAPLVNNVPFDFEDTTGTIVYNFGEGGGFDGNVSTIIDNPDQTGNESAKVLQMVKGAGQPWAGTTFTTDGNVNFGGATALSIDVWSPRAGVPFQLKLEPSDPAIELSVDTTTANAWETLIFEFGDDATGDFTGFTLFPDFMTMGDGSANFTFYIDNIQPALETVGLPLTFEEDISFFFTQFDAANGVIDNPDKSGINESDKVAEQVRFAGSEFAGGSLNFPGGIDFSSSSVITMKVWSPAADIPVLLKLLPSENVEAITNTTVANQWEELSFDFTGLTDGEWTGLNFVFNAGTVDPDNTTYYFDDVEVFGSVLDPIDLPVDFEDTGVNYALDAFEGISAQIVVDPTNAENSVVELMRSDSAATFAGLTVGSNGFANAFPFSETATQISMRIWSPAAGINVRMKVEDATNNAVFAETEQATTVAMDWETLVFDYGQPIEGGAFLDTANTYDVITVFPNFGTDGATAGAQTFYIDDLIFTNDTIDGIGGPAKPSLPIDFQSSPEDVDYTTTDFGGNTTILGADPTDATNVVAITSKSGSAEVWAGTTMSREAGLGEPVPLSSNMSQISVRVFSPDAGIDILLKAEDASDGGQFVETIAKTTVANAWETLVFDFSNPMPNDKPINPETTYNKINIFFNFGTSGAEAGSEKIYYWDDVMMIDNTPRSEAADAGANTITLTMDPGPEVVAGKLMFLDDGTELGKIASVAGRVITLEAPLAAAVDADSRITFVEDNTPDTTGGQLINLSTRSQVGTGDDVLIGGFVVGAADQQVLIQATGPELANSGVSGALLDPFLTITDTSGGGSTVLATNDNWQDTQGQEISDLWGGAPPLADGSLSAGVVLTLQPGTYTATISGVGDTTGVALIEVYEID
jgi:hypothetical protein